MRAFFLLIGCIIFSTGSFAQANEFPATWMGNWKGELHWYKMGKPEPQKVNMELRIHPADNANTWTWQIIYGSATEDNRPYKLVRKDSIGIHWVIDENNGIVLDQFMIGNKFCGAFTVMTSTIINSYWMEKDELHVEFYNLSAKPTSTTGLGTEESPNVDSYRMGSFQKAVLKRIN